MSENSNNNGTNNKILIAIIAVLAVVIIILLAVIIKGSKKTDSSDSKTTENQTTSEEASGTSNDAKDASSGTESSTEDATLSSGTVEVNAVMGNQWEGNGVYYGQIDVDVINGTADEFKAWAVEIPVSDNVQVDAAWNCEYEITDGKLMITGVEYNADILANSKTEGVGLILTSTDKDELEGLASKASIATDYVRATITDATASDGE